MTPTLKFILSIPIGLIVLSILVFVHELGHFLAAKACKIKVMAFAIGFGKPLYRFKRGETEYRINAVPFGGYVAMASDSPVGETMGGDNEFNSKPIWQRATVAIAGPIANFIFAVITIWVMFIHGVDRPTYLDSAVIGVVVPNSAAASSGFLASDSIVAVNGERIDTWEQVETRLAQQLRSYTLTVRRGGETLDLNLPIERTGARIPTDPTGGILPAVTQPVIGGITQGGSADKILAVGDTVLSVNGTPIVSFEQLSFIIRDYTAFDFPPPGAISPFDNFTFTMRGCDPGSKSIRLAVKRGGETLDLDLIPVYNPNLGRYLLGIQQTARGPTRQVRYGPIAAIGPTMAKTWEFTMMIFDVLGKLTRGAVPADQLAGPLNIIPMSGLLVFMGLSHILNFMALIGVNLAVLNLLPLVITDGGLLMFLAIEAARGKPLSAKTQGFINKVFIALFLGLFVFISFNDTQRLPGFFKMFR